MSLAEIGYLHEKGRISLSVADVQRYATRFAGVRLLPLDAAVVATAFGIQDIPELHDRLIAATARREALWRNAEVPVITNDPHISASRFVTAVW
jgi:PIN domain nuclease of toxin-antitoxin system